MQVEELIRIVAGGMTGRPVTVESILADTIKAERERSDGLFRALMDAQAARRESDIIRHLTDANANHAAAMKNAEIDLANMRATVADTERKVAEMEAIAARGDARSFMERLVSANRAQSSEIATLRGQLEALKAAMPTRHP